MVKDRTGRKLKVGQIVDIMLMGPHQAKVTKIVESPIILGGNQQVAPHIVVVLPLTPYVQSNGYVSEVYIIQEPDPNDPLVKEGDKSELIV